MLTFLSIAGFSNNQLLFICEPWCKNTSRHLSVSLMLTGHDNWEYFHKLSIYQTKCERWALTEMIMKHRVSHPSRRFRLHSIYCDVAKWWIQASLVWLCFQIWRKCLPCDTAKLLTNNVIGKHHVYGRSVLAQIYSEEIDKLQLVLNCSFDRNQFSVWFLFTPLCMWIKKFNKENAA